MPDAAPPVSAGTPAGPPPGLHRWTSRRVEVHDDSMQPTLRPGDRLRVDVRIYRTRAPAVGEIVVVVDPAAPSRWLVKRVAAVGPGRWWRTARGLVPDVGRRPGSDEGRPVDAVETIELAPGSVWVLGDAADASRDSRRFGAIPPPGIVGRAYYRYAPAATGRDL